VRRLLAILLTLAFLALATGVFAHLHDLQHRDDATAHDEEACVVHAQLRAPLLASGWVPLLVCLGTFVAFLSLITPPLVSQRLIFRLDCRGPPACS
jgi:hypothetical protein